MRQSTAFKDGTDLSNQKHHGDPEYKTQFVFSGSCASVDDH